MNITLSELLPLVGRLDSAPGFDTPRERFRRFLLEHITDVATARSLIDECQRSVGEQRHRALQDLIVVVGRFLGFEVIFGAYDRSITGAATAFQSRQDARHARIGPELVSRADDPPFEGQWRSRGLLDVALTIRTDQTPHASTESLAGALAAAASIGRPDGTPRIGLAVVARHYAARGRLEQAMAADRHSAELRIVSVRSLLTLAAHVTADRLSHLEVVKLLQSGFALDFVINLLDRPGSNGQSAETPVESVPPPAPPAEPREPAFWVATILDNESAAAEQLLASVIAHRRVLGICHAGALQSEGAPGDWVCFFLPGKGIVGHAQLASVIDNGASVVRNAAQFSCVYRLMHVELYEEPIVQALRAGRPFAVPPADVPLAGPCLSPIARDDFIALTTYRDEAAMRRASA
jgi:hypothetical protein